MTFVMRLIIFLGVSFHRFHRLITKYRPTHCSLPVSKWQKLPFNHLKHAPMKILM